MDYSSYFGLTTRKRLSGFDASSPDGLVPKTSVAIMLFKSGAIYHKDTTDFRLGRRGGGSVLCNPLYSIQPSSAITQQHVCMSHDYLLGFTAGGHVYSRRVFELPKNHGPYFFADSSKNEKPDDEHPVISRITSVSDPQEEQFVVIATANGRVKRIQLDELNIIGRRSRRAIQLEKNDHIIDVAITRGNHSLVIVTHQGRFLRFREHEIPLQGKTSRGVRGISLHDNDHVVALVSSQNLTESILVVSTDGYCKRTPLAIYPGKHRNTEGFSVIGSKSERYLLGARLVMPGDRTLLYTNTLDCFSQHANHFEEVMRGACGRRISKDADHMKITCLAVIPYCLC